MVAVTTISIFLVPPIVQFYNSLKERSNRGYLYEMTCEKPEQYFVNCKLEGTDLEGKKRLLYSAPIRGATSSVVTVNIDYDDDGEIDGPGRICNVSLIKRDGTRIENLELFQDKEPYYRPKCQQQREVVSKINNYILENSTKSLYWSRDMRVGDLTKGWYRRIKIDTFIVIPATLTTMPFLLGLLLGWLFDTAEYWEFDKRSGKITYRKSKVFSKYTNEDCLGLVERIVVNPYQMYITIRGGKDGSDEKSYHTIYYLDDQARLKISHGSKMQRVSRQRKLPMMISLKIPLHIVAVFRSCKLVWQN